MTNAGPARPWPTTVDVAVERLLAALSPEWKAILRGTNRDGAQRMNLSLGRWVRNQFGMWRGNLALLADCARLLDREPTGPPAPGLGMDPDEASALLLGLAWDRLMESEQPD